MHRRKKVGFWAILIVLGARIGLVDASAQVDREGKNVYFKLDTLFRRVYERSISEEKARLHFTQLLVKVSETKTAFFRKFESDTTIVFPLAGYSWNAIGRDGKGYLGAHSYDFFDGNVHKGHPAHDIFIHDANQDSRDDRTQKRVPVLAFQSGVVASVTTGWDASRKDAKNNPIRSGNCVWLLSGKEKLLTYYAHLDSVTVEPGEFVRAGESLGYVGRTGLNAAKKRSTTHLHFMCLTFADGALSPINPYHRLIQARLQK